MASFKQYTASGGASEAFSIKTFSSDEIKVYVDNVLKTAATHYNITSYTTNGGTVTWTTGNVPNGVVVRIVRDTKILNDAGDEVGAKATYQAGSSIKAGDLNTNQKQTLRALEEQDDQLIQEYDIENGAVTTNKIASGSITNSRMAANSIDSHQYVDGSITEAHIANGAVTTNKIESGSITNSRMAANSIDSHQYVDGSIALAHMAANSVDSSKIVDGSIVNADINASAAIAGTKVSPAFGSQAVSTSGTLAAGATTVTGNITVSGTVDGRDVATDGSKLDGIEAGATADQTNAEIRAAVEAASDSNVFTDADHSKLNAIEANATADQSNAEIRAAVEAASDSNVFTDADHSKLNAIEAGATADQTNAEIRAAVEAASDSNVFTDADHSKLNGIEAGATADQTVSEIKSLIASSPLDASHLAANSVGTSEIESAQLSTLAGMQSGTASTLASGTALSASTAEINKVCDGMDYETSSDGISATDAKYATSSAIINYVAAQIAPIGGLEVIATDAAFPNTQPAAGVVISIADAGGIVVNGSGTSTTGRTVGGSTVTINNIASNFNNSTIADGVAMMVSSTGSSQIYNYHKATLKEADLLSLSNDINDFAARYRVANTAPSSSLDEGDLWWDSSTDKLKVYDGSSWEEVASSGDFYINTISSYSGTGGNSATFNGSAYRFVLSNPGSSAQQHVVSINGVIQKPNSGTSQPSEGFVIDGSSIIFSNAPATGSDYFILTLGTTVSIGTPSDNTVSTAKIQNGAVITEKLGGDLDFPGHVKVIDNKIVKVGTGADLQIAHDGTNSYLKNFTGLLQLRTDGFRVNNNANDEVQIKATANGAVELYYDDTKRLQTYASGVEITGNLVLGDSKYALFGDSSDLKIYHNGSHSYIQDAGTGSLILQTNQLLAYNAAGDELMIVAGENNAVELYYDNVKRFETYDSGCKVVGNFLADAIYLQDSEKINLGNADDLQIYHSGSNSFIVGGTGNIRVQQKSGEDGIVAIPDGAIELYHNNIKTIETISNGILVQGTEGASGIINLYADEGDQDADKWQLNAGADGFFYLANYYSGSWETNIKAAGDGAVELYHNNTKRFETTSAGISISGTIEASGNLDLPDWGQLKLGTDDDLLIYHNGSKSYIKDAGTGSLRINSNDFRVYNAADDELMIKAVEDGAVELYHDNGKKLETDANGVTITGQCAVTSHIAFPDHSSGYVGKAVFGGGDDLQIYHDGSNSYIKDSGTGNLKILANSLECKTAGDGETTAKFNTNGSVELYHNNLRKFSTDADGIAVHAEEGAEALIYITADEGDNNADKWLMKATNGGGYHIQNFASGSWENNIVCSTEDNVSLYYDNSLKLRTYSSGVIAEGHVRPSDDDTYDLGINGAKWDDVYATNGTIQTSDRNEKNTIVDSDLGLSFINKLKPVSYKFNNKTRTHYGLIAQDIETVLSDISKPSSGFAGFVKEDDSYGLRYNEFIAPLIKAVQELSAEVETLKTKVAALEAK